MSRSVDSLRAFMATSGRAVAYTPTPGVIAVGSGKGGVGTSLVSALLAIEAARRGERVLLVDADESVGSLHMMLGVSDAGPGLGALRGGAIAPRALLRPVLPGLALLPGGGGGIDATLTTAVAEHRALLRRVWGIFPDFSTVVIDGGSRLDSVTTACAAGVERLVCVTTADRISLAASYALFKVVRSRFESLPIELVVNGTEEHQGRTLHGIVRAATQSFLGTDVRLGGIIPRDARLGEGVQSGHSMADSAPNGTAMSAAGSVVDRILSERQAMLGQEASLFPVLPTL